MSKEQAKHGRDETFRALADPTRRKILRMLNAGEMSAGDIAGHFDISGPSMSHHFNVLKTADLIRTRRNGQQIFYSLNTTVVQDLMTALIDLFPGKDPKTQEAL
jgi:ArsR family transcriptional regulator, arsenate/arsenite/antimonite-responsive transcriptional repressor